MKQQKEIYNLKKFNNYYYTPSCCNTIIPKDLKSEEKNIIKEGEWCVEGNKLVLEENKYFKEFMSDGRFSLFHRQQLDIEDLNAINASLWSAEKSINIENIYLYKEAILYYAAHLLYTSFVVAESESISMFKLASSDIRGNELTKSTIYRIAGKDESWDTVGLLQSPFGMHLRSLIQQSCVGFVTL